MINWPENFSMDYNSSKVGTTLFKVRTKVQEISEKSLIFLIQYILNVESLKKQNKKQKYF